MDRLDALRILARGQAPEAVELLGKAIAEGDTSRTEAAIAVLSELNSADADTLLLDALVTGSNPRSRTATVLEPRVERLRSELVDLAASGDAAVRYWSLTLLERVPSDPESAAVALARACDGEPMVRAAAAKLLAHATGETVVAPLRSLLRDEEFFVRAHAARAAGGAAALELAGDVSALLADSNWWVRAAAREGLLALGPAGIAAAVDMLDDGDGFARDGACEVIAAWDRLHGLAPLADESNAGPGALVEEVRRRAPDLFDAPTVQQTESVT
jgi:HEAT repeat protein